MFGFQVGRALEITRTFFGTVRTLSDERKGRGLMLQPAAQRHACKV